MSNPLLKAAGITPETKGRVAERALFDAAWECVESARYIATIHKSALLATKPCNCPVCVALTAFDEAAKFFQEYL